LPNNFSAGFTEREKKKKKALGNYQIGSKFTGHVCIWIPADKRILIKHVNESD
jgi:hypothetical protein